MKKHTLTTLAITLFASLALIFSGCGDNDFEDAGEAVDDMIEDAGDAVDDATND